MNDYVVEDPQVHLQPERLRTVYEIDARTTTLAGRPKYHDAVERQVPLHDRQVPRRPERLPSRVPLPSPGNEEFAKYHDMVT